MHTFSTIYAINKKIRSIRCGACTFLHNTKFLLKMNCRSKNARSFIFLVLFVFAAVYLFNGLNLLKLFSNTFEKSNRVNEGKLVSHSYQN